LSRSDDARKRKSMLIRSMFGLRAVILTSAGLVFRELGMNPSCWRLLDRR